MLIKYQSSFSASSEGVLFILVASVDSCGHCCWVSCLNYILWIFKLNGSLSIWLNTDHLSVPGSPIQWDFFLLILKCQNVGDHGSGGKDANLSVYETVFWASILTFGKGSILKIQSSASLKRLSFAFLLWWQKSKGLWFYYLKPNQKTYIQMPLETYLSIQYIHFSQKR